MSNDQRPSARWSPGGGGAGGLARSGAGGDQMARGAGDRSHWAFDHSLVIGSLRHWSFRLRPFHWKQRGARISHPVSSGAPAWSRLGVLERPKPVTDRRSGRSGIQAGGEKCGLITRIEGACSAAGLVRRFSLRNCGGPMPICVYPRHSRASPEFELNLSYLFRPAGPGVYSGSPDWSQWLAMMK